MNIDTMLSQILYCLSGFLFGIFASRYSVISWRTLAAAAMRALRAVYHRSFYAVSLLADYPYRSRRFYLLCDAAVLFYKGLPR